jgi:hypothetical protein
MFKADGYYPTEYVEGVALFIDDLKEEYQTFNKDGSGDEYKIKDYKTQGCWFLDESCEQKFTGITTDMVGDITLYANLSYAFWSPSV